MAAISGRLAARARTPRGAQRLAGEPTAGLAPRRPCAAPPARDRARRARSSTAGDAPPFGGLGELSRRSRARARADALPAEELLELAGRSPAARLARLPRARAAKMRRALAELAAHAAEHARARAPRSSAASSRRARCATTPRPSSRGARREARELPRRDPAAHGSRCCADPDAARALSDAYVTVRDDRYVLPVRADARGARARHRARRLGARARRSSSSREALVELNNRLKQRGARGRARGARVLRELSPRAARRRARRDRGGPRHAGAARPAPFARAALASELDASAPEVDERGRAATCRSCAIRCSRPPSSRCRTTCASAKARSVLVISGPNAGGKTVAMKAVALAALLTRAGLHVPAARGRARRPLRRGVRRHRRRAGHRARASRPSRRTWRTWREIVDRGDAAQPGRARRDRRRHRPGRGRRARAGRASRRWPTPARA